MVVAGERDRETERRTLRRREDHLRRRDGSRPPVVIGPGSHSSLANSTKELLLLRGERGSASLMCVLLAGGTIGIITKLQQYIIT